MQPGRPAQSFVWWWLYDDDGCRVSVHLVAQAGRLEPRPDDWAIVLYEQKGDAITIADDLEAWRSSGLTH